MNRAGPVLLGAAGNIALLVLPLVAAGALGRLADPGALCVLLLSTLAVIAESGAVRSDRPAGGGIDDHRARRLALATGVTLWLVHATAVVGVGSVAVGSTVSTAMLVAGGLAMLVGAGLRRAAVLALRSHFRTEVTVTTDQPLVTDGIFARCRHPSELGLVLLALGSGIATASVVSLATFAVVLVPLVATRIRLEEGCLVRAFGDAYRDYAARVPALLGGRRVAAEPVTPPSTAP